MPSPLSWFLYTTSGGTPEIRIDFVIVNTITRWTERTYVRTFKRPDNGWAIPYAE